jgi:hypothetical protein
MVELIKREILRDDKPTRVRGVANPIARTFTRRCSARWLLANA